MRKHISIVLIIVTVLSALALCTACGSSNSVVGTWIVKEYEVDGETVSTSKIGEIFGEIAELNNEYKLVFTSNGNLVITSPNYATGDVTERKAAYTVQDDSIEVFDPDDSTNFELIDYDRSHIYIDMGGYIIVMVKK